MQRADGARKCYRCGEIKPAQAFAAPPQRTRYLLDSFERNQCVDCGEGDPVVLQFDHLRDKRLSIGQELSRRSWRSILAADIEKCEVVRANCHRRRTARRRGSMRAVLTELA